GIAPTAYVTVRIPAKEFDAGVTATKQLGEVKSEHVSGQDVTAEYVDLEAQIRNLRATEQQFLTIMQRATQIQDVLAVQRELSIVRGQIEQIQGRMKYLSESAEMSTLTINLSTDAASLPVIDQKEAWKPLAVAKDALRSLLNLGKAFVNFLIWFAIYFPLWALLGLVVWGVYRWWMRKGGI
ncbi:MAG TPA: DUF4349 domain-containing protein, partial [Candidatus Kapabacteria bacterium]|nr:DUF4349 domain-containing protein [Candidatus Kapabacteria bacterium]